MYELIFVSLYIVSVSCFCVVLTFFYLEDCCFACLCVAGYMGVSMCMYSGTVIWNSLPLYVKNASSVNSFKS